MSVLVATPCYGGQVTDLYLRSVVSLLHSSYDRGVRVDVLTQWGESLIPRARNDILAAFWAGDWDDLLFVDGDIGFRPQNAWRLLESEHDVCAAPYPLKRIDWDAVSLMGSAEDARAAAVDTVVNYMPGAVVGVDGFAPVLDAGTGFMRVSRDAVELMLGAYPDLVYEAEGGGWRSALFDPMVRDGRYLSEDYAFCRRWQDIGFPVMVDVAGPALQHRGLFTFGEV